MNKTIFLSKNIEVLVVSFGGVGTTFLMDAITPFRITNRSDNGDGYKHLPIPPLSSAENLKTIYIFGDPVLATVSLFRRGYHHTQSHANAKFQNFDYLIPENKSLDAYAAEKRDGLYLASHLKSWLAGSSQYPVLFLKYDAIYDSLDVIQSFLDLPDSFVAQFQKKKNRKSKLSDLSPNTVQGLSEMYGELQKEIDQYPGSFILEKNKKQKKYYQQKNYRNAFKEAFFKKYPLLRKVKNKLTKL